MEECNLYLAEDGSLVEDEDYFMTIEPQALFIVAKKDEIVKTGMSACAKNFSRLFSVSWMVEHINCLDYPKSKMIEFLNGMGNRGQCHNIYYFFNEMLYYFYF